jgi:hypothetical protein
MVFEGGFMMQNKIVFKQKLLDQGGHLANPGYSLEPLFDYSRKDITASIWRIKEWDYYAVTNSRYAVTFTIADLGYSAMITVVFLDFNNKKIIKKTQLLWLTFGKLNLPSSSLEGNAQFSSKYISVEFIRENKQRIIHANILNFDGNKHLFANLTLKDLKDDSIVIATPWRENLRAFYYNQKINCMPTSGSVLIGDDSFDFNEKDSFAVLDWGRGVWTYKNTWYWSSLSGVVNGKRFGFNLGYGFGDTSNATENILFYDGKAHKLDQVTFDMNNIDVMSDWMFSDNENRLVLTMKPILDRKDDLNFGIIKNLGDQVFGLFSGYAILDDGTKIEIKDMLGFAEKITNHY